MARRRAATPRTLTDGLESQDRYKAGMRVELQKFQSPAKAYQLILGESLSTLETEKACSISGLEDLSIPESKALSAIQVLLDKRDYRGDETRPSQGSFKSSAPIPVLAITRAEYYEAYGLERGKDGLYHSGITTQTADKALQDLSTKQRRIVYERKYWTGSKGKRKELSDLIVETRTLIKLDQIDGYQGLDETEASQVREGEDLPKKVKVSKLRIIVSPLLVDGIEDFYTLKPKAYIKELEDHFANRTPPERLKKHALLMVDWLQSLDLPDVPVSRLKLAGHIGLSELITHRRQARLAKYLKDALDTAVALHYLTGYEEDGFGMYTLHLNRERMGRKPKWPEKAGTTEGEESDDEA